MATAAEVRGAASQRRIKTISNPPPLQRNEFQASEAGSREGEWAWSETRGWFWDGEDMVSQNGSNGWQPRWNNSWSHHNNSSWSENWKDGREELPPEWDGKEPHITVYFCKIDIWEATTQVAPYKRGLRLLGKLKDEAFSKMETVAPAELAVDNSVQVFKDLLLARYEPIENYRTE